MPALSILTVTFNAADTLAANLESVNNQTIDAEHILIDGKSSDATMEIVGSHMSVIAKVVSEPDNGIYDAMNKGITLATGEVIGILNADDVYASNDVLQKVAAVFEDETVDACYGDLVYFSNDNPDKITRYWRSGEFSPSRMVWGWMPPHPTFFVRRSLYEKYGLFNLELGTAADYEFMLRLLLKHHITVKYIPEVLVKMRTGGASNESIINRLRANKNDRKAWQINGLEPYPWTLWMKPLRKMSQWWVKH